MELDLGVRVDMLQLGPFNTIPCLNLVKTIG
jgi:hypothetical protein